MMVFFSKFMVKQWVLSIYMVTPGGSNTPILTKKNTNIGIIQITCQFGPFGPFGP